MVDGSRLLSLAAVCYCRALTHLSVAACQLGDLEGLGACTGLQQLHAPHNDIADLAPLAGGARDHSRQGMT
jgi:Leucine-rich repeat (LRR) protein